MTRYSIRKDAAEIRSGCLISSQEDLNLFGFPNRIVMSDQAGNDVAFNLIRIEEGVCHYKSHFFSLAVFERAF